MLVQLTAGGIFLHEQQVDGMDAVILFLLELAQHPRFLLSDQLLDIAFPVVGDIHDQLCHHRQLELLLIDGEIL